MLKSVLLYLNSVERSQAVIGQGMPLAQRSQARVRGLTLVDTRRIEALTSSCESAVYLDSEIGRVERAEQQQTAVCTRLSQACLTAGVDFDVRRISGDPFEILPQESQYHDLVVAAHPGLDDDQEDTKLDVSGAELVDLIYRGVQPMLIVRTPPRPLNRVLLVYDGTAASGRAVRSCLGQNLFLDAEFRLLAVGDTNEQAHKYLCEMAEYCRAQGLAPETGYAVGSLRRILIPYAEKWQADLLVLGVTRGNRLLRKLVGETAQKILRTTDFAIYTTG